LCCHYIIFVKKLNVAIQSFNGFGFNLIYANALQFSGEMQQPGLKFSIKPVYLKSLLQ